MKVRSLITQCQCGGVVPPNLLWVGENNTLIAEGICLGCGEKVQAQSTFQELYAIARELKNLNGSPLVPPLAKVDDKKWLKDMGVSLE